MRESFQVARWITAFVLMGCYHFVSGQQQVDTLSGVVSYATSQHIYVRFNSTKGIEAGDTLFTSINNVMTPALLVKHLSSSSCVTSAILQPPPVAGAIMIAKKPIIKQPDPLPVTVKEDVINQQYNDPDSIDPVPAVKTQLPKAEAIESKIKGRLTAASYLTATDQPEYDRQRMRYTFSMTATNIAKSKFSFDSYISFRHTLKEWQEVKDDFNRVFKIYGLSIQYDVNPGLSIWAGRKINYNLSNIGAIDGIQAEKKWKSFFTGAFAGSRPDHTDYHFNFNLLQFGAYAGNKMEGKNGTAQNTLAFAEQRNHGMTDRRFGYFQHINTLIKRVNIFTSFEFDLYTIANNQPKSTFNISSVYVSARYRVSDKLSLFGSYDARKNIIYYETYKNFIDQLLEDETRQGFRFTFNYRPVKYVSIGSSAGYRFQKDNPDASKNLHSYVTHSRLPGLNASATLSLTFIESPYLQGLIYGGRISKDLLKGKLYGELAYRIVEYRYKNVETPLLQSIAGANISWRMNKKFSFGLNYEGEIRNKTIAHRIYTNLTHRL